MKKLLSAALCMLLIVSLALSTFALAVVKVSGISLDKKVTTLDVGKTYALKIAFTPANTTQKLL